MPKLDRLGRDAVDVLATIRRLGEMQVKVIVLQLGKLDLTSPAGRMLLTMLAAVAEMERDLLVERTKVGLERARSEGKTLGRPCKTTQKARTAMATAHQGGATISALARQHGISRATVLSIIRAAAEKEQAPPPAMPANAAKGTRECAVAGADYKTDMQRRAILEQQHGQLRLHP